MNVRSISAQHLPPASAQCQVRRVHTSVYVEIRESRDPLASRLPVLISATTASPCAEGGGECFRPRSRDFDPIKNSSCHFWRDY
ncbi:unnamed protein product [Leptosia nina]|uniref:Uncharacterized protein n=1 Tax=Leptosia nina TaxID=320188 RepID=A0AAV1K171_9NEOP